MNTTVLDQQTIISRAVLDHSECAEVFQRHRIDFCCKGNRSIGQACRELGLDAQALLYELERTIARRHVSTGDEVARLPSPALVEYIVARHHTYLRDTLPFVGALCMKVGSAYRQRDPRLMQLDAELSELTTLLLPHLDYEERALFPAMIESSPDPELIANELEQMAIEHRAVGTALDRMRDVAGDYRLPDWACTSYRTLFAQLVELERDVMRHVHLENHVLLPRFS